MLFETPHEELTDEEGVAVLRQSMASAGRRHAEVWLAGICAEHLVDGLRAAGLIVARPLRWTLHHDRKGGSAMKLPLTGGCVCGSVRYEVTAEPISVYACHCTDCQRITSSAFSIGVVVPDEAFRLTGNDPRSAPGGVTAAGRVKSRLVCSDCGTWMFGTPSSGTEYPGMIRIVRGGTFDDTTWLKPTAHFWTRSKQPWVALTEGATLYETQPNSAPRRVIDEIYRSSNGDRWQLIREDGQRRVRHDPNLASGGRTVEIGIDEFLERTRSSPENLALRELLERLAEND